MVGRRNGRNAWKRTVIGRGLGLTNNGLEYYGHNQNHCDDEAQIDTSIPDNESHGFCMPITDVQDNHSGINIII